MAVFAQAFYNNCVERRLAQAEIWGSEEDMQAEFQAEDFDFPEYVERKLSQAKTKNPDRYVAEHQGSYGPLRQPLLSPRPVSAAFAQLVICSVPQP